MQDAILDEYVYKVFAITRDVNIPFFKVFLHSFQTFPSPSETSAHETTPPSTKIYWNYCSASIRNIFCKIWLDVGVTISIKGFETL